MTELERFKELVTYIQELIFGTEQKPKPKKRKRARKSDGTFKSDNKSTPNINEAWEKE